MTGERCGKPAPTIWLPHNLVCIKPKGHTMNFAYIGKGKRKVLVGEGHMTHDERCWPVGSSNMEFV